MLRRMETQRQEFQIGVMVLVCIVSLTLMVVFFGKGSMINFGGEGNTTIVRFQRAPGVKPNTPVFKNGVQIGRVSRVELIENDRQVQVTITLDRGRRIYTDEECQIRQSFVMGDASLEFAKILNFTGKVEEVDHSIIPYLIGVDATDLLSGFGNIEGDLTRAIQNVADAADQMGTFVERLNSALGTPEEFQIQQERFQAIVNETRQTMFSVRQTTDGINRFVNDPEIQSNVRKVINDMPGMIDHSRMLIGESTLFVHEARRLAERGHGSLDSLTAGLEKMTRTLDVISNIANQVEGDVPEIVTAIKRSALRLESLFGELTMIVENFRNADGTVKRLIRDPEAYEKLLATLDNVEKITDEVEMMLRVDAKPIAHNVKILTDKAARDPSVFIRNLLRKEPPIKAMPFHFGGRMLLETPCSMTSPSLPRHTPTPPRSAHYPPPTHFDGRNASRMTETPIRVETIPQPNIGRIVNVDPRYRESF